MNNYEIIKFRNDGIELDVNVSPTENTVWLSQLEMSVLFQTTKNNISLHTRNVISEGELDLSTTKESLVLGPDGKTRKTKLYNLEMVISVGYRVKSRNGIIFRRWANEILKDFLIKGYTIDSNRTLITKENYLNLCVEVSSLRHEVKDLKKQIEIFNPNEKVLVENQIYTAFVYMNALLRSAEKKIIIIDGYLDDSALEFFSNVNRTIKITLITHKANRFTEHILNRFKKEFINTTIVENKIFHDRFIIVDDTVYSIGASLNNLGNKLSTIKIMVDINPNDLILNVLKEEKV